jgi:hypothetical protein
MRWNTALLCLLAACGTADEASDNPAPGARTCTTSMDCDQGFVCLTYERDNACTPICTGDTDACGAEASCGGVGVMEVEVCQPATAANAEEPPQPEEQPKIPCKVDSECSALQAGAICAEWQGARDCTIPCAEESDCDMPEVGGIRVDFMRCAADEAQPARRACLPDPACFNDPFACIDMGGLPGGF